MRLRASISAISAIVAFSVAAGPAAATCTKLAFSVNDYGKEGPTNDAKRLLDTYIAKWTSERGIAKYNTGKKEVTCELFLDFGVFDEHTCKAAASVCWDGPMPAGVTAASLSGGKAKAAAPKAATTATTKPATTSGVTTGSIPAAPKAADAPKPQ